MRVSINKIKHPGVWGWKSPNHLLSLVCEDCGGWAGDDGSPEHFAVAFGVRVCWRRVDRAAI